MVGWTNRSLPATLETLDLSYNQGGMAWFSMAQVATSNLTHLYLRGNNLSTIVLTQQTLPPSLTYLDLSDNPNVIVFADRSTYTSLARQQIVLKVNTSLATVSGFCLGSLVLPISPTAYVCIEIEGWATAPPSQAPQTTMPSSTSSTTICIYVATIVGVMWSIFLILYIVTYRFCKIKPRLLSPETALVCLKRPRLYFVFSIHTRQIDAVVDFRDCLEDFNMDGIGAFLRTNKDEPVPVEKSLLRWCLMSKVDYGINLNMKMHALYRQAAWGSMRDAQLLCLVEYDLIE
ncbi:hypothetical protein Ae201684P_013427 [Aphanomyces euteiches]|nr:hypothetical protein Ae201684P_013427 [Aphanomyces euteiches]